MSVSKSVCDALITNIKDPAIILKLKNALSLPDVWCKTESIRKVVHVKFQFFYKCSDPLDIERLIRKLIRIGLVILYKTYIYEKKSIFIECQGYNRRSVNLLLRFLSEKRKQVYDAHSYATCLLRPSIDPTFGSAILYLAVSKEYDCVVKLRKIIRENNTRGLRVVAYTLELSEISALP